MPRQRPHIGLRPNTGRPWSPEEPEGYDSPKEMVEALAATPDTLRALLSGVSQERARAALGGDEGWSVVEVMCHLRDAEEYSLGRMRAMRDRDDPAISGFDQEGWATERHYADADLREALDAFLISRAALVAELSALSPEQWERTGRHDKRGRVTIAGHTLHTVWHDAIHLAQLARQLA